jgi:hypothetical protein
MTLGTDPRGMTEQPLLPDSDNAAEASLAARKAGRDASARANRLADRLAEVDLHQREARYLLERAGMLTRKRERP